MGKSQETWNKKENEKKKQKKKKEKEAKREERKANPKGNSFEIAYVDEFGNFSSTPPDPSSKVKVKEEDIQISVPRHTVSKEDLIRKGIVTFYNDSKGYGFIKDLETQESVFVHVNNTTEPIKENNKVTYEVEMGPKGPSAVKVKVSR
ncbi:MAG: cold shock domain-containing protein [Bacteroidota bacterium]|nr:cold shock domain-containing protein [Bacteroidota bacterium]